MKLEKIFLERFASLEKNICTKKQTKHFSKDANVFFEMEKIAN